MEWVETTAKTIEAAEELALDQLGIDREEAEFVVLEEPHKGLFGYVRGTARVRARVAPRTPRPKVERRKRRSSSDSKGVAKSTSKDSGGRSGGSSGSKARQAPADTSEVESDDEASADSKPRRSRSTKATSSRSAGASTNAPTSKNKSKESPAMTLTLEEQITTAESFLAGLLDAFGLEGQVETRRVDDANAELNVTGDELGILIGQRGHTVAAIQELTRISLQRKASGSYEGRVRVDVSGYREQRRAALARFVESVASQVLESGTAKALEPMVASDRKVVHDVVNTIEGVHTTSEGSEPRRWVMIQPDED